MNLYEKLGKEEGFYEVIYTLYLELVDHVEISHHFVGVNIIKLSNLQTEYLCKSCGSLKDYTGRDLKEVHMNMGITPFQFNIVVDRIKVILKKKGLDESDIATFIKVFKNQRGIVITAIQSPYDRFLIPWYKAVFLFELIIKKLFINNFF
jgi:hemoglobin